MPLQDLDSGVLAAAIGLLAAVIGVLGVVVGSAIGAIGAVIGAVLGNLLSSETATSVAREAAVMQQRNEIERRVWDLRRLGYSVVLEKLSVTSKYADQIEDGFSGFGGEQFQGTPTWRKWTDNMSAAWRACESEFRKHQLVCSSRFIGEFQALRHSLPHEYEYDTESEERLAARNAECFRDGHDALWQVARSEFGLDAEGDRAAKKMG